MNKTSSLIFLIIFLSAATQLKGDDDIPLETSMTPSALNTDYNNLFAPMQEIINFEFINLNKRMTYLRDVMESSYHSDDQEGHATKFTSSALFAQLDDLRDDESFRYQEGEDLKETRDAEAYRYQATIPNRPWSLFAGSSVIRSTLKPFNGGSGAQSRTLQELIGLDHVNKYSALGLQGNYTISHAAPNTKLSKTTVTSLAGRAYATFIPVHDNRHFFVDGSVSFRASKLHGRRFINDLVATSYARGISWNFTGSVGYDVPFQKNYRWSPRVIVTYVRAIVPDRFETGGGIFNTHFGSLKNTSLRSSTGFSMGAHFNTKNITFITSAYAFWLYEFTSRINHVTSTRIATGLSTTSSGLAPPRSLCRLGTSFRMVFFRTYSFLANYSYAWNNVLATSNWYAEFTYFF